MSLTNFSSNIEMAKRSFNENDLVSAQKYLDEVIDQSSESSDVHFLMGNIHHVKGELGSAIKCFKKVLELDPGHTDAAISLSVIYNDIGKYDEAKTIFESADKRVKSNMSTPGAADEHLNKKFSLKHFELAEMYFSYQRYDEALFEYNKAVTLNPEDLAIRIKVAKVYAKKGFSNKAIEELQKLKSENPNYAQARIALGLLYYGKEIS